MFVDLSRVDLPRSIVEQDLERYISCLHAANPPGHPLARAPLLLARRFAMPFRNSAELLRMIERIDDQTRWDRPGVVSNTVAGQKLFLKCLEEVLSAFMERVQDAITAAESRAGDQSAAFRVGGLSHVVVVGSGGCTEALRALATGIEPSRDVVVVEHDGAVSECAPVGTTTVLVPRELDAASAAAAAAALDQLNVSASTTVVVDDAGRIESLTGGALGRLVDRVLTTAGASVVVGNSAPDVEFTPAVLKRVVRAGGVPIAVGLVDDELAQALGFAEAPRLEPGVGAAAVRLGAVTLRAQIARVLATPS